MVGSWDEYFEDLRIQLADDMMVYVAAGHMCVDRKGLRIWYAAEVGDMKGTCEVYPQGFIKELNWTKPRVIDGI